MPPIERLLLELTILVVQKLIAEANDIGPSIVWKRTRDERTSLRIITWKIRSLRWAIHGLDHREIDLFFDPLPPLRLVLTACGALASFCARYEPRFELQRYYLTSTHKLSDAR